VGPHPQKAQSLTFACACVLPLPENFSFELLCSVLSLEGLPLPFLAGQSPGNELLQVLFICDCLSPFLGSFDAYRICGWQFFLLVL
jgi:hypothetical protein